MRRQCKGKGRGEVAVRWPFNCVANAGRVVSSDHLLYWAWNMYVEIKKKLFHDLTLLCSVYISNWRRVKLVLGCSPFEQRHTGELMASFVEDVRILGDTSQGNKLLLFCLSSPSEGGWPVYWHCQQHDDNDDVPLWFFLERLPQPHNSACGERKFNCVVMLTKSIDRRTTSCLTKKSQLCSLHARTLQKPITAVSISPGRSMRHKSG